MRSALLLAWRYLTYHRLRSVLIVLCVALVVFLPVAVQRLVRHFERMLGERAAAVPLIVGAPGSRFDLVLSSLYFRGGLRDRLDVAALERLQVDGLADVVPVNVGHAAGGHPVVGVAPEYFEHLALRAERGRLPLRLGEAVLGHDAARALALGPGDAILTDTEKLYDPGAAQPLRLRVCGVLAATDGPDDQAVFVDLKTSWVVEGIGHGHVDVAREADPAAVVSRTDDNVAVDASVVEVREVTPDNVASFHFHGDPANFPVSALLVWPRDARASTILKGRYAVSKTEHMLEPSRVVEELMGFLFRLKRFFDANTLTVAVSTVLFLVLIVALTLKLREREIETLFRIGCSRGTVLRVQAAELALLLGTGVLLGLALAAAAYAYGVRHHIGF